MTDFSVWTLACQTRIESVLAAHLPPAQIAPARLHEAMRYAVLGGGKRVRPLLAFAAGEFTGAHVEQVQHVAAAVELIHAYSLVHDDMPAMDDDTLRRGKPTVHVEFDEATALLVGDALQSLAFDILATQPLTADAGTQLKMVKLLAQAAGSRGMAGGQAIDLASVGKPLDLTELEFMHIHKTGALIRASVLLGAHCGTLSDATASRAGSLRQVHRPCLPGGRRHSRCRSIHATLGKTAGKDAANNKPTYVSLLGVARARELAQELRADAHASPVKIGRTRRTAASTG